MSEMEVFYINLDRASDRREAITRNFAECNFSDGWRLHRFNAIAGASDLAQATPGRIGANLKGAHLSHLACVRLSLEYDGHALIVEDDTQFGPVTEYWVDRIISQIPEDAWDVILMDFYVPSAVDWPNLLKIRRECMASNAVKLINAALWPTAFAGAGSYIVNRRAKEKFLAAMSFDSLDHAYDLLLRQAMVSRTLIGVLTFPFLTTVAEVGDESSNQGDSRMNEVRLAHLFRRLVWMGAADPAEVHEQVASIKLPPIADDVATLSAIMTPLLSLQMHWRT